MATDQLGVRIARKTLLAVAGLVSIHDRTWTTGRSRAVQRWSELKPDLAVQLGQRKESVCTVLAARFPVPETMEEFQSLP